MPACCIRPRNQIAENHPRGHGWQRVICRVCGKWLGDRLVEKGKCANAFSPAR